VADLSELKGGRSLPEDASAEQPLVADPTAHADLVARMLARVVGGSWSVATCDAAAPGAVALPLPAKGGPAYVVSRDVDLIRVPMAVAVIESAQPLIEALIDAEQREEEAKRQAMTDHLTGLANRWGWELALVAEESRCQRHGRAAVVAVIDLDDLKRVNDTDGHLGGDMMLRMAADAIRRGCRQEDFVARIGGDEFGVIAVEDRMGDEEAVAGRLRLMLDGAGVAASVGTAVRGAMGGLRSAYRHADAAMYADKQQRKGR
jgi:diguanylate cyclase (GGDEF)-like protein